MSRIFSWSSPSLATRIFAGLALAAGFAVACGHEVVDGNNGTSGTAPVPTNPGNGPPPAAGFDKSEFLGALADCAVATYTDANTKMQALAAAVTAFAAAPADAAARDAAKAAYLEAMNAWQVAEVFQFGPLGMNSSPGGEELRDPIYSWPLFARCAIEDHLVAKRYESSTFLRSSGINARGLLALEFLLFFDGTENVCPPGNAINSEGTWTTSLPELPARRVAYAKVITDDIARRTQELVASWGEDGKNFAVEFRTAGKGSQVYTTDQMALNAVNLGLFYAEREVKDMKLAWPINISGHCAGDGACPEALESQYANASRDYLIRNFEGFRKLFVSCNAPVGSNEGLGFAAYLRAANATGLADRMTQEIDNSINLLRGIEDNSLRSVIGTAEGQALYAQVKKVTDDLKTEFVTVLDLDLPQEIQGDND